MTRIDALMIGTRLRVDEHDYQVVGQAANWPEPSDVQAMSDPMVTYWYARRDGGDDRELLDHVILERWPRALGYGPDARASVVWRSLGRSEDLRITHEGHQWRSRGEGDPAAYVIEVGDALPLASPYEHYLLSPTDDRSVWLLGEHRRWSAWIGEEILWEDLGLSAAASGPAGVLGRLRARRAWSKDRQSPEIEELTR